MGSDSKVLAIRLEELYSKINSMAECVDELVWDEMREEDYEAWSDRMEGILTAVVELENAISRMKERYGMDMRWVGAAMLPYIASSFPNFDDVPF